MFGMHCTISMSIDGVLRREICVWNCGKWRLLKRNTFWYRPRFFAFFSSKRMVKRCFSHLAAKSQPSYEINSAARPHIVSLFRFSEKRLYFVVLSLAQILRSATTHGHAMQNWTRTRIVLIGRAFMDWTRNRHKLCAQCTFNKFTPFSNTTTRWCDSSCLFLFSFFSSSPAMSMHTLYTNSPNPFVPKLFDNIFAGSIGVCVCATSASGLYNTYIAFRMRSIHLNCNSLSLAPILVGVHAFQSFQSNCNIKQNENNHFNFHRKCCLVYQFYWMHFHFISFISF